MSCLLKNIFHLEAQQLHTNILCMQVRIALSIRIYKSLAFKKVLPKVMNLSLSARCQFLPLYSRIARILRVVESKKVQKRFALSKNTLLHLLHVQPQTLLHFRWVISITKLLLIL